MDDEEMLEDETKAGEEDEDMEQDQEMTTFEKQQKEVRKSCITLHL